MHNSYILDRHSLLQIGEGRMPQYLDAKYPTPPVDDSLQECDWPGDQSAGGKVYYIKYISIVMYYVYIYICIYTYSTCMYVLHSIGQSQSQENLFKMLTILPQDRVQRFIDNGESIQSIQKLVLFKLAGVVGSCAKPHIVERAHWPQPAKLDHWDLLTS